MSNRNLIVGLACLAVSLWLLVLTRGLPPAMMVPVGPAFYPRVVLSFMALLSALLVGTDLLERRRRTREPPSARPPEPPAPPRPPEPPAPARPPEPPAAKARPNYALVLATFVAFALYVLLLPKLGFRIATLLFVVGLQVTLAWPRSARAWLVVALVAIGTTVVCDLAFERYLSVLLPRGDWTGL